MVQRAGNPLVRVERAPAGERGRLVGECATDEGENGRVGVARGAA